MKSKVLLVMLVCALKGEMNGLKGVKIQRELVLIITMDPTGARVKVIVILL